MNKALVENAQHYIDRHKRGEDEYRLVFEPWLERLRGPLKAGLNSCRQSEFALGGFDLFYRIAQRYSRCKIERNRYRRKLALMIYSERGRRTLETRERAERHLSAVR